MMKKILLVAVVAIMGLGLVGCNGKAEKTTPLVDTVSEKMGELYGNGIAFELSERAKQDSTLKIDKEDFLRGLKDVLGADTSSVSYLEGMKTALQFVEMFKNAPKQAGFSLNAKKFVKAFEEAFMKDSLATQEQLMQMQMAINPLVEKARAEALENDPKAVENKKAGEAYINKKKANKSYKQTKSGLVYKVIKEGEGDNFTESDVVMTQYEGKHIDGKVFDNGQGQPQPMACNRVIPGFAEMLKLMKPGMKVEVVIPAKLAYGINGIKSPMGETVIGPNETLVFTMETLGLYQMEAPDGREVPVTAATGGM